MRQPERGPRSVDYAAILAAHDRAWQRFRADPTPHNRTLLATGFELLLREYLKPGLFELGQTVATPGAVAALDEAGHVPLEFLLRHKRGDWGELDPEDVRENEWSLANGARLFSRYSTRLGQPLYVITEWDRSATTMLLPVEY